MPPGITKNCKLGDTWRRITRGNCIPYNHQSKKNVCSSRTSTSAPAKPTGEINRRTTCKISNSNSYRNRTITVSPATLSLWRRKEPIENIPGPARNPLRRFWMEWRTTPRENTLRQMAGKAICRTMAGPIRVRYEGSGPPKNTGPQPHSPPSSTQPPWAGCVFWHFLPQSSPRLSPRQVSVKDYWWKAGPSPWNEWGRVPDRGRTRIFPKVSPQAQPHNEPYVRYSEARLEENCETTGPFVETLRLYFGDMDAKEQASNKITGSSQAGRTITEYWHEFRIIAAEREYDEGTRARVLLGGMSTKQKDAWKAGETDNLNMKQKITRWEIAKENKHSMMDYISKVRPWGKFDTTPQNINSTFSLAPVRENHGDPIELDATRRRPGSTSRPKNTTQEWGAIYASNGSNQDTELRHAKGRLTAKKELSGNQGTTTRRNGGRQLRQEKCRLKEKLKKSRETMKVPVNNGLRDGTKPKPIDMRNLYPALNNTKTFDNENNLIIVQIWLHGTKRPVTINAMIDMSATKDFIDKGVWRCSKYDIRTIKVRIIQQVYLADSRPSTIRPITHIVNVPMDIGSHTELATFRVSKLPNHELICGMPRLMQHSCQIDWGQGKITFESERWTT